MAESKSSRKEAIKSLVQINKRSDFAELTISEMFPFGVISMERRNPAYDRDIVITSSTLLEHSLEESLIKKLSLRPDCDDLLISGTTPVLRDFREKIQMAYLVGIIGPMTRGDLGCIRAIRNTFAHSRRDMDFDTPEIANVLVHIRARDRSPVLFKGISEEDLRENYIRTSYELMMYLFETSSFPNREPKNVLKSRIDAFAF